MINLPAYLHLCESVEALGSGLACYRLSQTYLPSTVTNNHTRYLDIAIVEYHHSYLKLTMIGDIETPRCET